MRKSISFSLLLFLLSSCVKQEIKQYSVEQFYKNQNITGGSLSTDESKVLISSNESGIYNLYEIIVTDGSNASDKFHSRIIFCDGYVPHFKNGI
jgi:hypothetical protein